MVPANQPLLDLGVDVVLHHRGTAKLAAPDDQDIIQHPALFEVGDQTCNGLVDLFSFDR